MTQSATKTLKIYLMAEFVLWKCFFFILSDQLWLEIYQVTEFVVIKSTFIIFWVFSQQKNTLEIYQLHEFIVVRSAFIEF